MNEMQIQRQGEQQELEQCGAEQVGSAILRARPNSAACITCSFQAEGIIVLHMLRKWLPRIPVLFLDTGYHFPETLEFRDRLARDWNLNLVNLTPVKSVGQQETELGVLYQDDPARCCQLRKVEPLMRALDAYKIWFTGLRREQSPTRRNLRKTERHRLPSGREVLKVNPLADWTWAEVWEYTSANRLPYLPQYDRGYLSIGCEPCTVLPADPGNPRSGRWEGKKLECGIHTFSEIWQ
ncbi:MAG TPA: phosphoadenylyl-sulfate reductase [Candidatus Sulfotelmatobacter sp.]|nr:phosphoadenylyl-sulfate reductase [Candidatus Sulfotelmatobacter sp.]